jgi:hypothetical protein
VTTQKRGIAEWRWEETDIPGRRIDDNTPFDYDPYGTVQFSEFANWTEVVEWAAPLYQSTAPISPELGSEIEKLRAIDDPEERTLGALRFVQNEIRYLGIESGVGSHQPTDPSEVLRRRFGDCKDKTLLLATLLRETGLRATPALVSSRQRGGVAKRLPSPGRFNHVILQVEIGDAVHWLDATRSCQRGPLSQIRIADYECALVLRSGIKDLTACTPPPDSRPRKKVIERYHINRPGEDATLRVVTEFRGAFAESTRSYFQTTNIEDIQKHYLEYYARRFAQIYSKETVAFEEMPDGAGCLVKESYIVPGIWQMSEETKQYTLRLDPNEVEEALGTPGTTRRSDPLALAHPVDVTQEIHAEMFEEWVLTPKERDITNPFFHFHHQSRIDGAKLQMDYSYASLVNRISVDDLPAYDSALRSIRKNLGYSMTYTPPDPGQVSNTQAAAAAAWQFNWPVALMLGTIMAGAIPLSVRYYYSSKLPSTLPPSLTHSSLEGIGGWLLLVSFGLVLRPFSYIHAQTVVAPSVFNLQTWQNLTHFGHPAYHPFWMPTLLFELIFNSLVLIYSILLVVLFFKKRAVWPRCYILFLGISLFGNIANLILGSQIPAVAGNLDESIKAVAQLVIASLIWIPYCLTSKRVKATFRH